MQVRVLGPEDDLAGIFLQVLMLLCWALHICVLTHSDFTRVSTPRCRLTCGRGWHAALNLLLLPLHAFLFSPPFSICRGQDVQGSPNAQYWYLFSCKPYPCHSSLVESLCRHLTGSRGSSLGVESIAARQHRLQELWATKEQRSEKGCSPS